MEIPVFIKRSADLAIECRPGKVKVGALNVEQYNERIASSGWRCIGDYVNRDTPVLHECTKCGAQANRKPHTMHNHIKRGTKCSGCIALERKALKELLRLDEVIKAAERALKRRETKPITRAAMKTPDGKMSFYVFRDRVTKEIKVGISVNVVERLKTHRNNSRDGISVLHVVHTTERNARFMEQECISSLYPWRSRNHAREWFIYSDWALFQIEEIMSGAGVEFTRLMPVSESLPSPMY